MSEIFFLTFLLFVNKMKSVCIYIICFRIFVCVCGKQTDYLTRLIFIVIIIMILLRKTLSTHCGVSRVHRQSVRTAVCLIHRLRHHFSRKISKCTVFHACALSNCLCALPRNQYGRCIPLKVPRVK